MKYIFIFCTAILSPINVLTMEVSNNISWHDLLKEYKDILKQLPIIKKQYKAFINHTVPLVNTPCVTTIPTQENNNPIVDLKTFYGLQGKVCMMPDPEYPVQGPQYNSGLPGNSRMRADLLIKLGYMAAALDETAERFGYKKEPIDVHICDALRKPKIDQIGFTLELRKVQKDHPDWSSDLVHSYALTYAATGQPDSPVIHAGGGAVDLRLWDNKNRQYIDMGDFGVPWSSKEKIPTFTETISHHQKMNRLYCLVAAAKADLINYPYEFWHFSTGDSFYAYWTESDPAKRICLYAQVANNNLSFSDVFNFKSIRAIYALVTKSP